MVRHPTITSELPWARAGGLIDFLDYLRIQGFRITANEYAATHELIVGLIDRGIDVQDENVVKSYLGPLLHCMTFAPQTRIAAFCSLRRR